MIRLFLTFIVTLAPIFATADEQVVAGLSQNRVAITSNFDGTGILIFGAVKRVSPPPDDWPLQVIITVSGPRTPVVVRRKEKWLGIWVNTDSVNVDLAPSFYAVATTAPLNQVLSEVENLRHKISVDHLIRSVGVVESVPDAGKFSEAIVRIRQQNGLYTESAGIVDLTDETLFRTQISLPANLVEGNYLTRIFLTRDRRIVDAFTTNIFVRKVGLERWIFNLAHQQPLIYGILSLAIAILAGWAASAIFRLLRLN